METAHISIQTSDIMTELKAAQKGGQDLCAQGRVSGKQVCFSRTQF